MSKIVYKNEDFLIVNKDAGQSSQSDKTGEMSLLDECSFLLKSEGKSDEIYLVHRLDKVVGGLLVFARNKTTAAKLSKDLDEEDFSKDYLAVVDGVPLEGEYKDYLCKNSVLGKSEIVSSNKSGAKEAILNLIPIESVSTSKGTKTLVKIKLQTGRFHQIRAQLSSRECPIVGDKKYGSKDSGIRFPSLFAYMISFKYKNQIITQKLLPDINLYPWNLFDKTNYEELIK